MAKPSTKTNAMRKALRYAAASIEDDTTTGSVTFTDGRQFKFNDADREALKALAAELRDRAAGRKGKPFSSAKQSVQK